MGRLECRCSSPAVPVPLFVRNSQGLNGAQLLTRARGTTGTVVASVCFRFGSKFPSSQLIILWSQYQPSIAIRCARRPQPPFRPAPDRIPHFLFLYLVLTYT